MRNLPFVWINGLKSYEAALEQVSLCLSILKEQANESDFHNINDKRNFQRNLAYMKMLFERAELLARGRAKIL